MTTEFCEYTKFLLERMETNPEDFVFGKRFGTSQRFAGLAADLNKFGRDGLVGDLWIFTKEEREALRDKFADVCRNEGLLRAVQAIMTPTEENQNHAIFKGDVSNVRVTAMPPGVYTANSAINTPFTGSGDAGQLGIAKGDFTVDGYFVLPTTASGTTK